MKRTLIYLLTATLGLTAMAFAAPADAILPSLCGQPGATMDCQSSQAACDVMNGTITPAEYDAKLAAGDLGGVGDCNVGAEPPQLTVQTTTDVLLIGDSLMQQSAPYWQPAMGYLGKDVTVTSEAVGGTGLLYADSWSRFIGALDRHPGTDVVVIEYIGNCAVNPDSEPVACEAGYGTFWYYVLTDWMQDRMVAEARARGITVRWVNAPTVDNFWIAGVVDNVRAQTAANMASLGVPLTDWAVPLSYDGASTTFTYLRWLQHFGAGVCLCYVRTGDGVHFTADGAQWVAEWEAQAW